MSDSTSYGLLSRMRSDNGIPWEDFHKRYHDLLILYGRGSGLAGQELEELVNDVLFELFHKDKRSLFRYDKERGRFRHYLKSIAQHRAADLLRRRTPAHRGITEDLPSTISALPDLEQQEESERQKIIMTETLQELKLRCSPQHMQIFLAYVIQGQPAHEVAGAFGLRLCNVYTIKSRLQKEFQAIWAEVEELV